MATTSRQARREMDRISSLPDEPLCHILSFLQTQEAAATSVLSKRWRHLWTSVPTLDFDFDEKIYSNMGRPSYCFEKFIYATILARDARQPIRSFRLKYEAETYCRNADVNVWVNTVLQRGIENLHLWMSKFCRRNNVLRIVSCKTLVVLKLRGLRVYASSPVELPSLKSLHLEHVEFRKRQSILELVRGCPIIEDLKARTIHYVGFINYADRDPSVDAFFCDGAVKILPKLVRADLSPFCVDVPLKAICNVEFLTLNTNQYPNPLDDVVPKFPNLIHVVLQVDLFVNWPLVLAMLKNCPKLQVFELDCEGQPEDESFLPDPHFVPECLTSQFRKCSLEYYYGTESELRFAKYIMQNSTTLRTMTICSKPSLSPQAKLKMLKQLALCPKRCELSFE